MGQYKNVRFVVQLKNGILSPYNGLYIGDYGFITTQWAQIWTWPDSVLWQQELSVIEDKAWKQAI